MARKNSTGKEVRRLSNFVNKPKVSQFAMVKFCRQQIWRGKCVISRLQRAFWNTKMVNFRDTAMIYESLVQEEVLRNADREKLKEARADVEKENTRLCQYIDIISEQEGFQNCGKPISEVKGRQQRRKIRELKTYVEKALWFAETFGLKLSSVEFADDDGKLHTIEYQSSVGGKKCYKDLSDGED